ncbi:hypothetical protein CUJ83_09150 [Methanocella sp. CWC-04]|uniref:Phosphatidic acid phosphatase type 2/haloperoxidase domain-containing protein n=1 Tax=Methanooceanicella nereidis TaxID=2052831 RepID=A0AAP2RD72_9EURY|nr:phosphatase PAP2 family protein [Methanocella sp. CWC-04]MCD1295163.1 hypothetical protein [Methanocella sp. CWC-04]
MQGLSSYDQYLFTAITDIATTDSRSFFLILTQLGNPYVWLFITAVYLIFGDKKKIAAILAISLIFSIVVVDDIKEAIERPRPEGSYNSLFLFSSGYSFPSGHSQASFLIAVIIGSFLETRYRLIGYGLASIVGISRIHLGVHYPSDVIAGALLGIVMGLMVNHLIYSLGIHGKETRMRKALFKNGSRDGDEPIAGSDDRYIYHKFGLTYLLLGTGIIMSMIMSMIDEYGMIITILTMLFIVIIIAAKDMMTDKKTTILAFISLISMGLVASISTLILEQYISSLMIVAIIYLAALTLSKDRKIQMALDKNI